MPSSCSDNHEKSLCATRGVERRKVWSSRTCYPLWKVQQSVVTRRNEWKKHDEKKLISVFDSRKSFSLNLKRDSKKIASIIFLSGLRLLWYMQCGQSYYSHTQKDLGVLCAFHQLSTLHLCGKIRILYDTVKVRLLVTSPLALWLGVLNFVTPGLRPAINSPLRVPLWRRSPPSGKKQVLVGSLGRICF